MSHQDIPTALMAGDRAPPFQLADPQGRKVSSADILGDGPLVITFYRGMWCPYCKRDLEALEAAAEAVRSYGAALVAISRRRGTGREERLQAGHAISFPLLDDAIGEVAQAFGISARTVEVQLGAQMPTTFGGDTTWILPMQARYVINQDGVIVYADINTDYRQEPQPLEILPILRQLSTAEL